MISGRNNDKCLEPRYTTTLSELGESRVGSSANISGRSSKSNKIPLINDYGSSSRDERVSKTADPRYYSKSFLDSNQPQKKLLSCLRKEYDVR